MKLPMKSLCRLMMLQPMMAPGQKTPAQRGGVSPNGCFKYLKIPVFFGEKGTVLCVMSKHVETSDLINWLMECLTKIGH